MYRRHFDTLFTYLKAINGQDLPGFFLELIAGAVRTVEVQAGETLATHLYTPRDCWFIAEGIAMEYLYNDQGEKVPLRFFRKEAIIPSGFVEQQVSPTTIRMVTPGALLTISHQELYTLLQQQPEAHRYFDLALADYARRGRMREQLLALSVSERIHYHLKEQKQLQLSVPGKLLARYLSIDPSTYSRLKKKYGKQK